MKKYLYFIVLLIFFNAVVYTQEFGFGFDDTEQDTVSSPVSFKISGEAVIEFPFYFKDYDFSGKEIVRGKLNMNLSKGNTEIFASFNLSYNSIYELGKSETYSDSTYTLQIIDEAFISAYAGPVSIEAGYRKLTWGRADSSGPLDVLNPIDFTDLRHITDTRARKIARPMLHITWNTGSFSKLEGVFIPNFTGHRFESSGRWTPNQYSNLPAVAGQGILDRALENYSEYEALILTLFSNITPAFSGFSPDFPDTASIKNFQSGLRYTTTINSVDIGFQYFYGMLFRPSFTINGVDNFINNLFIGNIISPPYYGDLSLLSPQLKYTRFHQLGVDYAQVLSGFNVRAELALNLTENIKGTDGSLHNPFIAWSLGFDRGIIWGINLNIQCNETIRLFNDKVGSNPVFDSEAGTNITNTRITTQLSKKYFKDNLETRVVFIWDIENSDCYIIPSIIYTYKDMVFSLTAGFFAGNKDGELGQYYNNNFIRLGMIYSF